jgi:GTP cyclohydrolase II
MKAVKVAETSLPTSFGTFRLFGFESDDRSDSLLALLIGQPADVVDMPLVRIHSQCLTGDVFGSVRCDCGAQLEFALTRIAEAGSGLLLYQLQEGRGIGLMNKLLAYELQDSGHDTVEANHHLGFEADHRNYQLCAEVLRYFRNYQLCAEVLRYFSIERIRLMSNNPGKLDALVAAGIQVKRVPIEIDPSDSTQNYLRTKKDKLGHLLSRV